MVLSLISTFCIITIFSFLLNLRNVNEESQKTINLVFIVCVILYALLMVFGK